MPARLIREGLLDSERVCRLPLEARWLFVTVCLTADDVGIFDAAPYALMRKAELQRDLGDHLLQVLADADLIRLYEIDGKRYGFIPRYGQRLQMRRIKHPLPPLAIAAGDADAISKINELAARLRKSTESFRRLPPEAEAEAEAEAEKPPVIVAPSAPASSPAPAVAAAEKAPRPSRKCPSTFLVTGELQRWAREHVPGLDIRDQTARMRDHTFKSALSDWPGAWRNWMKRARDDLARRPPSPPASFRAQDSADKRRRLQAMTGGLLGGAPAQPELPITLDMETLDHGPRSRDD